MGKCGDGGREQADPLCPLTWEPAVGWLDVALLRDWGNPLFLLERGGSQKVIQSFLGMLFYCIFNFLSCFNMTLFNGFPRLALNYLSLAMYTGALLHIYKCDH